MNLQQLKIKLLEKWPYKLLFLAVAIFLYVFNNISAIEKKSFVIPLQVRENGSVMRVDSNRRNVTVTIRANPDQISSVHLSDFSAYIDLDSIAKGGEYSVPVNINVTESLLANSPFEIRVSPESLKVRVEKKDVQFKPVIPSLVGECAHGYEVTEVQVSPKFVEIIGPESVLNNLEGIKTEAVEVTNAKTSFSNDVNCKDINNAIHIQNKGPYSVTVVIAPASMERVFENISPVIIGKNNSLILASDIPALNITVSGTVPNLEEYKLKDNAVQIDLSSVSEPGTYELPVTVYLPNMFTLVEQSIQTVSVTLEAAPVVEVSSEEQSQ